jgi:V8-like Glu-specific endopeptidase
MNDADPMKRALRPALPILILACAITGASAAIDNHDDTPAVRPQRRSYDLRLAQAAGGSSFRFLPSLPGVTPPGTQPGDTKRGLVSQPVLHVPRALTVVQGVDRRWELNLRDFKSPPFSAIGVIIVRYANGREAMGTGFLVDSGIVLTAGHVLFSHDDGPAILARFTPGCALLQSSSQQVGASRLKVSAAWKQGRDELSGDYGAMFLPDAKLYAPCGAFSIAVVSENFVLRQVASQTREFTVAGFPAEKPLGTMWYELGGLAPSAPSEIQYGIDTTPGQSGAPLFAAVLDPKTKKRVPMAIGIHSRPAPDERVNQARRIDATVIRDLQLWTAEMQAQQR